jgi:cell division protein FtsW
MAVRVKTDWVSFVTIIAMACLGLVMVYSASSVMAEIKFGSTWYFISRQLAFAGVAFVTLMYARKFDYRRFDNPVWAFAPLGLVTGLLVLVYFIGRKHRWLDLGPASLQPSEFAKPALVIFLAWFIAGRLRAINSRHTIGPAVLALGMLGAAVVGADLGTAVVLVLTAAVLFYIAGLDRRLIFMAAFGGLVLVSAAVVAKPYRVARVVGYLDPEFKLIDKLDSGGRIRNYVKRSTAASDPTYQPLQSRISVGSGGVLGAGLMDGKQKLMYLPEAHTDYIYAVLGEELGLLGSTAILAGFFVLLWRGLTLFLHTADDFGRYLALGVTVSIVLQALINISGHPPALNQLWRQFAAQYDDVAWLALECE